MKDELHDLRHEVVAMQIEAARKEGALEERKKMQKWLCTVSVSATLSLVGLFYSIGTGIVHNFAAARAAFVTFLDVSGGGK